MTNTRLDSMKRKINRELKELDLVRERFLFILQTIEKIEDTQNGADTDELIDLMQEQVLLLPDRKSSVMRTVVS